MSSKVERCGRCGKQVYLTERKIAVNKTWHENCFSCIECDKKLTSQNFITHKGELFCKNCYPEAPRYNMDYSNVSNSIKETTIEDESNVRPSEIKQAMKKRRRVVRNHSSGDSVSASPKTRSVQKKTRKSSGFEVYGSPRRHSSNDSAYETENRLQLKKLCAKFKPDILCPNCHCPADIKLEKTTKKKPDISSKLNRHNGDHKISKKHEQHDNIKKRLFSPKEEKEKMFDESAVRRKEEVLFVSDSGNVTIIKIVNLNTKENNKSTRKQQKPNKTSLYYSANQNTTTKLNYDSNESLYETPVKHISRKSNRNEKTPKKCFCEAKNTNKNIKRTHSGDDSLFRTAEQTTIKQSLKDKPHTYNPINNTSPRNNSKQSKNTTKNEDLYVTASPGRSRQENCDNKVCKSLKIEKTIPEENSSSEFNKQKPKQNEEHSSKRRKSSCKNKTCQTPKEILNNFEECLDEKTCKKIKNIIRQSQTEECPNYDETKKDSPRTMERFKNLLGDLSNKIKENRPKSPNQEFFRDIFRRKEKNCDEAVCKNLRKKQPLGESCGLPNCPYKYQNLSDESIQKNPLPTPPKGPRFKIKTPKIALNYSILNRFLKKKQLPAIPDSRTEINNRKSLIIKAKQSSIRRNTVDDSVKTNTRKTVEYIFEPPVTSTPRLDKNNKNKEKNLRPSTVVSPVRGTNGKNRMSSAPVQNRTHKIEPEEFEPPITSTPVGPKQKQRKKVPKDEFASVDDYTTPLSYKIPENINKKVKTSRVSEKTPKKLEKTAVNNTKNNNKSRKNDTVNNNESNLYQTANESLKKRRTIDVTQENELYTTAPEEKPKKNNKKHKETKRKASVDSFQTATSEKPTTKNNLKKKPLKFGHMYSEEEFFGPAVQNASFCSCSTEDKYVTTEISPNKNRMSSGANKSKTTLRSIYTHIDRQKKFMVTNEISPTKNTTLNETKLKQKEDGTTIINENSCKNLLCKRLRSGSEFGQPCRTFSTPVCSYKRLPIGGVSGKIKNYEKNDRLLSSFNEGLTKEYCNRCKQRVYMTERNMADGAIFHKWCFSCYNCHRALDSVNLLTRQDEIFCKQCYMKLFGPHIYGFGLSPNLHYFN